MFNDNRYGSNSNRGNSGGYRRGGNSNRGGNSYGRNSGGYQRDKITFHTQCADCGNDCTVPFKPNGRKPVRCSDCFRGSNDGGGRNDRPSYRRDDRRNDRYDDRRSFDRPRYNDRPKQSKPKQNIGPTLKEEIKSINEKLERILKLVEREPVVHTIKKEDVSDLQDSIDFLEKSDME